MNKKDLYTMLESLAGADQDAASKAFSSYVNSKSKSLLEFADGDFEDDNDESNSESGRNVETYTAPSEWGDYLINGITSGLDEEEMKAADDWIQYLGLGAPVNCEDVGFVAHHDAYKVFPYGSDCSQYTFYRNSNE